MDDNKPKLNNVYPEAHTGPLGESHANYAKPKQYASKPEGDLQGKLLLWGTIITAAIFIFIVAYLAVFGKGRFLN